MEENNKNNIPDQSTEFNQIPQINTSQEPEEVIKTKKEGVVGPLIGSIIIIIIIIIGGIYFLNMINEAKQSQIEISDTPQEEPTEQGTE
jgi:ATP-dependent Zn protease